MKGRKTRWAVLAAMALVGGMASNALGIEAFQEASTRNTTQTCDHDAWTL